MSSVIYKTTVFKLNQQKTVIQFQFCVSGNDNYDNIDNGVVNYQNTYNFIARII